MHRRLPLLAPLAVTLVACGATSSPPSLPAPGASSSSPSPTWPTWPTEPPDAVPGYSSSAPAATDAAALTTLSAPFGFAVVRTHLVEGPFRGRVLLVVLSGGASSPRTAAAARLARYYGTQARAAVFTEYVLGRVHVLHSAGSLPGLGPMVVYSFAQDDAVYWILSDDDLEGGRFVEALVDHLVPHLASTGGVSGRVQVRGFGYRPW